MFEARRDPYLVWVSEIMLQQTVIKAVLPVYARFLERFPDIKALAAADEADVREAVRGLGYYRRFRMLHAAAKLMAERREWPKTAAEWRELPGIGDYTSAAIASIAFGDVAAVVDGNVERVFCRLLDLQEAPNQPALKRAFQALAQTFVAAEAPGDFNQALMELGQTLCTPTSPACGPCPLAEGCLSRQRGTQALAPAPKPRAVAKDVKLVLHVVRAKDGRFGLIERPESARFLKGALGLPTAIVGLRNETVHDGGALKLAADGVLVGAVRHTITSHAIRAQVIASKAESWPDAKDFVWTPRDEVEPKLIANLDRKAWKAYLASLG